MSALNRVLGSTGLGLFALLSGVSSAAAQTEAPAAPAAEAPVAPAAPAPGTPEGPAPEAPAAPEAPPTETPGTTEPEFAPLPPQTSAPVVLSGPAQQPPAPVLGEPTPTVASTTPVGVKDDASATSSDGESEKPRMFGAMFDLGVPDGTTLSFVYRPIDLARVHAGLSYNGVSPGLRIGGEFLPLGWGPSLGLAYGHYFEGDANGIAGMFGSIDEDTGKMLENVGYDYFAMRAGMEFGGDRFTFFARGGMTWLRTTIHELDSIVGPEPEDNTTIEIKQDPVLKAWAPTIQFGMIYQI
ncbi:MAG TPA: hypothetical protein VMG12_23140 [Polyangiaceae bacterium]|nr:hypothetical protein [Polyangiaceae bacterium]